MRVIIQIAFLMLFLIISFTLQSHILFIVLTGLNVVYNLRLLWRTKKELDRAVFYVRKGFSKKHFIWSMFSSVALFFTIYFLWAKIPIDKWPEITNVYFLIFMISFTMANAYQKFRNSIRSFDTGITLPKYIPVSLKWNEIKMIKLENQVLIIDMYHLKKYRFLVDKRDLNDANRIVSQFKNNS